MSAAFALAAAAALAWAYLLALHGRFWRADTQTRPSTSLPLCKIVACAPARDEADVVGRAVVSLLGQSRIAPALVVLCDDASADGTAQAALDAAQGDARFSVVAAPARPAGWTGKLWAMETARRAALARVPDADFIWFADADVDHAPNALATLVSVAEAGPKRTLASLIVRLQCEGVWEKLLIPAFVYFFQMLYPFSWANDPKRRLAAAAGGSMLVRSAALDAAGGLSAIRGEVIDDCALARLLKTQGPTWVGLADRSRSLRPYDGLSGVWRMVRRTAYVQLQRNAWILLGCLLGLGLVFLVPPLALIGGAARGAGEVAALGALGWAAMAVSLRPMQARYGLSRLWAPTLPLAAALYMAMTLDSAQRDWRGAGNAWKGRVNGGAAV